MVFKCVTKKKLKLNAINLLWQQNWFLEYGFTTFVTKFIKLQKYYYANLIKMLLLEWNYSYFYWNEITIIFISFLQHLVLIYNC